MNSPETASAVETEEEKIRAQRDHAWKKILTKYLEPFVQFFWQEAYHDIDWTKKYTYLEQELSSLGAMHALGRGYIDKLFSVFLRDGTEKWLILHLETQHDKDPDFEKRMLVYWYRIFDKYDRAVASMAVLADTNKSWRPTQYHNKIWGSEITRKFETMKLVDYRGSEEALKKSENPFAWIVLAQLAAMDTRPEEEARLITKIELVKYLLKHGWDIDTIRELAIFLDFVLGLNMTLHGKYVQQVKKLEEENAVDLISTTEQYGFMQGERRFLMNLLRAKFKDISIPDRYLGELESADTPTLEHWGINLINANSVDEVFRA